MRASILTIGDEILIGQIVDTNSAWLGEQLFLEGVPLEKIVSIADSEEEIIKALSMAFETSDLVIVTGGLGPTKDDLTKKAIAKFLSVDMYFDEEVFENVKSIFARYGRETTNAHKQQCYMPIGTSILTNKMGTAPGMLFKYGNKNLLSLPGVPYEMKWIFEHSFLQHLRSWNKGLKHVNKTIHTIGRGESVLEEQLSAIVENFPNELSLSFLPSLGKVRLRVNAKGKDKKDLEEKVKIAQQKIKATLGELVFGEDQDSIESVVVNSFREKNKTIGTAESCTGGNIAKRITSIPGSSAVFQGSIVAYSNELKKKLLSVPEEILDKYGAVSEETVRAMVVGAIKTLDVDAAVAVSGIAGPGGGRPYKPVGTIWLACGDSSKITTKKLNLSKNRGLNIEYSSNMALNMLRQYLM